MKLTSVPYFEKVGPDTLPKASIPMKLATLILVGPDTTGE
jgi:hypothetical protein